MAKPHEVTQIGFISPTAKLEKLAKEYEDYKTDNIKAMQSLVGWVAYLTTTSALSALIVFYSISINKPDTAWKVAAPLLVTLGLGAFASLGVAKWYWKRREPKWVQEILHEAYVVQKPSRTTCWYCRDALRYALTKVDVNKIKRRLKISVMVDVGDEREKEEELARMKGRLGDALQQVRIASQEIAKKRGDAYRIKVNDLLGQIETL